MTEIEVPQWAKRARDVFRAAIVVYALIWLIMAALALVELIFETDVYSDDKPRWLVGTLFSLVAVGIAAGVVWLVGAAVAGYREPDER